MDILLRQILGDTVRDIELSGDAITIGSAPDRNIQLLGEAVLGAHATLRVDSGSVRVDCEKGAVLHTGDGVEKKLRLAEGQSFNVGGHRLEVIPAPPGFDAALELRPDPDVDSSAYEAAFVTDLSQNLSKRWPAWTLLGLVLLGALVVPLLFRAGGAGERETGADIAWNPGPLHPAHELAIGNDCSACHTRLFQRVADDDCRSCHQDLDDHAPAAMLVDEGLNVHRCASCHREHNEPEHLIMTADNQCTDCHQSALGDSPSVTGFSLEAHPTFRARLLESVISAAGTGLSFDWKARIESVAGAREGSNLQFPHDIHLDEVKVRHPNDNRSLACGDCHVLAEDREHFLPIRMDAHCADCHELTFDATAPDRQLPHGQPREVSYAIAGFFANRYLNPDEGGSRRPERRRPDRRSGGGDRCTDSPRECAAAATESEITNQFTVRGCVTCHTVSDTGADDLFSRYQVHPVRLVGDYFDNARFDHTSHLVQEGVSGDEACLSCHDASASSQSHDLLMPDLDGCTDCHGDPSVDDVVVLQCTGCHTYHPRYARDALAGAEI